MDMTDMAVTAARHATPGDGRAGSLRRRLRTLLVAVVAIAALAGSPLAVAPAAAAGPTQGATFNDPTGGENVTMSIMRRLLYSIDGTKAGATIRFAFYTFSMEEFADKLIAAHDRGVNVQLLMDDHEIRPAWERVVAAFGTDPSQSSFAVLCHRSCMTDNNPSYMHAKFYMFSSTYDVSRVVTISSANPTYAQARHGWNDAYTMVGDTTMYNAFKKYFEDMVAGSQQAVQSTASPDYYWTATSAKHKAYFFPIGGVGRENDPMWGALNNIKCTGVASGYGSMGKTVVKVAMFQWSVRRLRLADKLWALDNAGCSVEILYNPWEIDKEVLASLRKPGGLYGGPILRIAFVDKDRDGIADHYVHNKYVLVNGVYAGDRSSKVVFTGSANWTNNALHYSNELMFRITDSAAYSAYLSHFVKLRTWAIETSRSSTAVAPAIVPFDRSTAPNEWLGPEAD